MEVMTKTQVDRVSLEAKDLVILQAINYRPNESIGLIMTNIQKMSIWGIARDLQCQLWKVNFTRCKTMALWCQTIIDPITRDQIKDMEEWTTIITRGMLVHTPTTILTGRIMQVINIRSMNSLITCRFDRDWTGSNK